ncbi:GntR family transcriptional regulator [Salipiger bermudensis]|uniref:Transcriptional regulatory protein n=1 Tax=Salipiger bermudensis (strain DSM 26914 / JCM 13377 / KCTC 12554 / HTCC2601) TaxID=314265 RepID=Q0FPN3_SALBH|nr:GntR family transcriptional regulator [Salipiger bermudensis]EAU46180.1 transcriptional regulatory protein [Salipiger bermudensis HTCC2601]
MPNDMMTSSQRRRPMIRRASASVALHDSLRERILNLDLAPGQYISRSEIAAEYQVSLTPVRDALIKLEEEGLIHIYPQSKTEVSKIDLSHARETHFLRLSLELEIVSRLAAMGASAPVQPARSSLAQQIAAHDANDLSSFVRLDRAFHHALYEAIGMEALSSVIEARSGHIDRLRKLNLPAPGKSESIVGCHTRILEAIERGDVEAARAVLREHLSGTLAMADEIRERNPDFFVA